jgi:hypothetical protein
MKTPPWLATAIAGNGAAVLGGQKTRAEADADVIKTVNDHPGYLADLGATEALRLLGRWVAEHTSGGDLFQAQMFPDLPATLRVTPKKASEVASMTAHDLDSARNILWARTENQMNGAREAAERERAAFLAFYDKVRPLLADGKTVGEVLPGLAAKDAGAESAA